jgi:hypothetical protein
MGIGRLGGGGLASRIGAWSVGFRTTVERAVMIVRREGIVGGIREVMAGRREVFEGLQRRGPLDTLANTRRPGSNLYVQTELQLSKAMKADFEVSFIVPSDPNIQTYTRSMLYNRDRTKGALLEEFSRRLQQDIQSAPPESGLSGIQVLEIDFVGLQQRKDVPYEWEPDDAPW